jgi:hypothetical protein
MRGHGVALAIVLTGLAASAAAQSGPPPSDGRTAEQMIETAREAYSVDEPAPDPCPQSSSAEIVVCRQLDRVPDQRLPSPTERANAAGEAPPDPVPRAPDVFGIPPCSSYQMCTRVGRTPPPIYIIDLSKIPEPLTPEEAAHVFRAEEPPAEAP